MKRVLILFIIFLISFTLLSQEEKEKESPIKSYELQKSRKLAPPKRNPFQKKEEIFIPDVKREEKEKEEVKGPVLPRCEFKGFIISKKKKLAIINIDGNEVIAEEGEEIMNLKVLSIKENEIEVLYLLTNENLKIPFTGGEW